MELGEKVLSFQLLLADIVDLELFNQFEFRNPGANCLSPDLEKLN